MDKIDLEEMERVADYYEKRKQTMIELGALKDPAYLATLAEGEAIKAFEALRPLVERVRELEIVEESLARNFADIACCPLCLIKDCPQYHKGDLGVGAFNLEPVDREQCKKSLIAHAEKGAKEFVHGQLTA